MQNCDNFEGSQKDFPVDDVRYTLICRLSRFNKIIQRTYNYTIDNKRNGFIKGNDVKLCIGELRSIRRRVSQVYTELQTDISGTFDDVIKRVQTTNTDLSNILKRWGTRYFDDFLYVCFGKDYISSVLADVSPSLVTILQTQFHPLKYTMFSLHGNGDAVINVKDTIIDYRVDDIRGMSTFDCFDISPVTINPTLYVQTNGVLVYIKNVKMNTGMFVLGLVDNMDIELVNSSFINEKYAQAVSNMPDEIDPESMNNFLQCICLKEWLANKSVSDLYTRYLGGMSDVKRFKQQSLPTMSSEFIARPTNRKQSLILFLLLNNNDINSRYTAYFLYDLLTMDTNGSGDTREQTELLNNFTMKMHELFNNALVDTIQYTNKITKLDASKINLEQQICLLNVDDTVKEKAMSKMREVKSKSDDGGSKARHYLDGLLNIPFGVHRKESIMESTEDIARVFSGLTSISPLIKGAVDACGMSDKCLTTVDIHHIISYITTKYEQIGGGDNGNGDNICGFLQCLDKKMINEYIGRVNLVVKTHAIVGDKKCKGLTVTKRAKASMIAEIRDSVATHIAGSDSGCPKSIRILCAMNICTSPEYFEVWDGINSINIMFRDIQEYMNTVSLTLDKSVYGHKNAKTQVLRVIGQWINGEQNGHCLGFEGPAGVGKTSLAKYGIADCLVDDRGDARPFSMIAIGGDANGSTLHGHNYTYVGSTWGSIVQILMDKKCMNPIIFIDELDKISKTEHGKELIGILTHMLDPTQNDKFQDKYFSGIDIDLSKVLFVLSYNDADQIDRILMDRIHRVKFSNLSLDEKVHIAKTYTLPEIYNKVGMDGAITISDETIRYIIDKYTCEAGVRKLKEKLFEIVSDINLTLLTRAPNSPTHQMYPVIVTIDDIEKVYFKEHASVQTTLVPTDARVGYANGLWANALGQGGTLPIEAHFYPCNEFLKLKLTGKQGDVMQESMNVAMTLAYKLSDKDVLESNISKYNGIIKYGIHIHTPEGATPKDGPSAGSCITVVLFSILNNHKIRSNCGITGEIQLSGMITAIGGLDLKILGSMKAGITSYFFPKENQREFDKFYEKYKDNDEVRGVSFHPVSTIEELLDKILVK